MHTPSVRHVTKLIAAAALAVPAVAGADVLTWDNGAGTSVFGTAANWNPDKTPAATDNLIINSGTPTHSGDFTLSNGGSLAASNGGTVVKFNKLFIGGAGAATLTIDAGARVELAQNFLSAQTAGSSGNVVISGSGSLLKSTSIAYIARLGTSNVQITDGGVFEGSQNIYLGEQAGSSAVVEVSGTDSLLTSATNILVGNQGSGSLTVTSGGTVNAASYVKVGATGSLTLDGGTVRAGAFEVVSGGSFSFLSGTLDTPYVYTSLTNAAGTLKMSASAGRILVNANYTQGADGILELELAGTGADSYDFLSVNGTASLDGTLRITLADGFTVTDGDVFHILDLGTNQNMLLSGTFASLELPDISAGGLQWDTSSLYVTGDLIVVPEPASVGLMAVGLALMRPARRWRHR